jgi:hypothetical protein
VWITRLEENGISVIPLDAAHVVLRRGKWQDTYAVIRSSVPLHPSSVGQPPEKNALLVVPTLSAEAAQTARIRGWSAIPTTGPAWVRLPDGDFDLSADEVVLTVSKRRPGRAGWGVFSVVRALLALAPDASQADLARYASIGQPRVSQVLSDLVKRGLVERTPDGWNVRSVDALVRWWTDNYPGPGGIATHWYGLASVTDQARSAYRLLFSMGARPVVSGDVAADLVEPWRVPQHALLYTDQGGDLAVAGLTPAPALDSTLTLVVPADRGVWPMSEAPHRWELSDSGEVARAGALQVLYDLMGATGADAADAADVWRAWMLSTSPIV